MSHLLIFKQHCCHMTKLYWSMLYVYKNHPYICVSLSNLLVDKKVNHIFNHFPRTHVHTKYTKDLLHYKYTRLVLHIHLRSWNAAFVENFKLFPRVKLTKYNKHNFWNVKRVDSMNYINSIFLSMALNIVSEKLLKSR